MPTNEIVEARFLAAANTTGSLPPPIGVEIAFAGRSNVGKSSLLNKLMARRSLARTSSTPGCTRGVNFFEARTHDDVRLTLVDLPGYGYAQRSKEERKVWAELIEHYLLERPSLAAVVVLVDVRRGFEQEELDVLTMLKDARGNRRPPKAVVVATKLDRLPRAKRHGALQKLGAEGRAVIGFSNELPETTLDVWRALRAAIV